MNAVGREMYEEIGGDKVLRRLLNVPRKLSICDVRPPSISSKPGHDRWYHQLAYEPSIPPSLYNIPRSGKTVLGDRMRSLFKQGTTEYVWSGGRLMRRNTAMPNYFKDMKPAPIDSFPRTMLSKLLSTIFGVH